MATSIVTLRAVPGALVTAPLRDHGVRDVVMATALAVGERTGVGVVRVTADEESLLIEVEGPQVVAVGFAAEVRRVTDAWHRRKYGTPLWGTPGE